MNGMTRSHFLWTIFLTLIVASSTTSLAQDTPMTYDKAQQLFDDGNFQEALAAFRALASDSNTSGTDAGRALQTAINCLNRLNRSPEIDDLRDAILAAKGDDWQLLAAAAQTYMAGPYYGYMISGEFERGNHRGGGRYVSAFQRDRVQAIRLLIRSWELGQASKDQPALASVLQQLAQTVLQGSEYQSSWQLQYLTDLESLPDYNESPAGYNVQGAAIDDQGAPIIHTIPKSWASATSDGQRWRWALAEAARRDPSRKPAIQFQIAQFFSQQFGVQTLQQYGWYLRRDDDVDRRDSTYVLDTLSDDETIARLANGIRRFALPEQANFIRMFQELTEGDSGQAASAWYQLGTIYLNRRQFARAAEQFKQGRKVASNPKNWDEQIEQIEGNWGRFEAQLTRAGGAGAKVDFRFRNGNQVDFTAHEIDISQVLTDMKNRLKKGPQDGRWRMSNINQLGFEIVNKENRKYIGKQVAAWSLELTPPKNHADNRITVTTPLQKPGAYLLTASMKGGNTSKIVVWLSDMAIVTKAMENKKMYVVTDAQTGQPISKANIEFLGYRQEYKRRGNTNQTLISTANFAEFTDRQGIAYLPATKENTKFSWIAIARKDDRLAFLGFSGVWQASYDRGRYSTNKAFFVTDRPVYRPQQTVEFKAWVRRADYDNNDKSQFAGQEFTVEIHDPKGERLLQKQVTADEFGGLEGAFPLAADTTLGTYRLSIPGWSSQIDQDRFGRSPNVQGGSFRVEEYKKPEFEVQVEAPDDPIALGDKFTAKVQANYYFGAPVASGKVKIKVLRTTYSAQWYPPMPWDWLYGPGYWWFHSDYDWYPGFARWGCRCPSPWWFWRSPSQPEVVTDTEAELSSDGSFEIEIDTSVAKALHPDHDHSYQIQAEVVDESRRTIVGNGTVLVSRQPFRVYTWLDRGYLRVGDTATASFAARTLDGKPIQGKGTLQLFQVKYADDKPVETEVQSWDLRTNEEGLATQQIAASESGQYRLSFKVTDASGHTIEGAQLFSIIGDGFDGRDYVFNDIELVPDRRQYAPGDTVRLQLNTRRSGGYVLLFVRPHNSVYLPPKIVRMKGKSTVVDLDVSRKDMPNFYVEAVTVHDGKLHQVNREIFLPPERRVLNVTVEPTATEYRPGEKASVQLRLTDENGNPFVGSTVVAIYDKSVEYISGGSNVPDIREFFWKWRRYHHPQQETNLRRAFSNLVVGKGMRDLGIFGQVLVENERTALGRSRLESADFARSGRRQPVPAALESRAAPMSQLAAIDQEMDGTGGGMAELVQPTVRSSFADTALWVANLTTDAKGVANVELEMPENLTAWEDPRVGHGTRYARRRRIDRGHYPEESYRAAAGTSFLRRDRRSGPFRQRSQLPRLRKTGRSPFGIGWTFAGSNVQQSCGSGRDSGRWRTTRRLARPRRKRRGSDDSDAGVNG